MDKDVLERFERIENEIKNNFGWLNYRIDDLVYEKILLEKKVEHNYFRSLTEDELIYELKRWYYLHLGKKLDLENPVTFNEKIQWLKIYDHNPLKRELADKVKARDYIEHKIGKQYLIPEIGVYDYFDQIDFRCFPNQFVLKCNHGSGWNEIIRDKDKIDLPKVKRNFDYWMSLDYAYYFGFEMQYKNIERKILVERYIEQLDGNLFDYKIHCFMGVPQIIQVIGDREAHNCRAKQAFYNIDWKRLDIDCGVHMQYKYDLPKPSKLDELLKVAERLSKPFQYVRIDLYEIEEQIKFGEFTFTPNSGVYQWNPQELDILWGEWVCLGV